MNCSVWILPASATVLTSGYSRHFIGDPPPEDLPIYISPNREVWFPCQLAEMPLRGDPVLINIFGHDYISSRQLADHMRDGGTTVRRHASCYRRIARSYVQELIECSTHPE